MQKNLPLFKVPQLPGGVAAGFGAVAAAGPVLTARLDVRDLPTAPNQPSRPGMK